MSETSIEVPYLDLQAIHNRFRESDTQLFLDFHDSGQYIGGKLLTNFETEFASFHHAENAVGCGNGLEALTLILLADKALGNLADGARVLVPAHTYIATVLSIVHADMQPVLVDVENMHLSFQNIINHADKVDAIIGVDLYGKLIDEDCFAFAKAKKLPIYIDSAQSHGAFYPDQKFRPRAAAYSFYPTKNLGAMGDGGAVLTDDQPLAEKIRQIANYGRQSRFKNIELGLNSRLDPLQAGLLSIRLSKLEEDNRRRQEIARIYLERISNVQISLPDHDWLENNVHHVFPVFLNGPSPYQNREKLINHLTRHGVGYSLHYPIPPHKQPALTAWNKKSFPRTEFLADAQLSIPCNPVLTDDQVNRVIDAINSF